jgi:murein DD-endopeptidase MepM/ murein hydrolase activator NlpD
MIGDGINPPLGYRHLQATVDTKMKPDGGHHIGVDFNLGDEDDDLGAPLKMIADGVCIFTGQSSFRDLGKIAIFCCKLPDGNLVYPRYAHMLDWNVSAGQKVKAGETVGKCGKSGWEKGNAHLHLDVGTRLTLEKHYRGIFADPWWYPHKAPVAFIERYYIDPVELIENHQDTQNNLSVATGVEDSFRYRKWVAQREIFRHRRK